MTLAVKVQFSHAGSLASSLSEGCDMQSDMCLCSFHKIIFKSLRRDSRIMERFYFPINFPEQKHHNKLNPMRRDVFKCRTYHKKFPSLAS